MQRVSQNTGIENDIINTIMLIERKFNNLTLKERKELQLVLKYRGLYGSSVDGLWGKNTRIAFALYLAPMNASSAPTVDDLFAEIKRGFLIERLWSNEEYEAEVRDIYSSSSKVISLEPRMSSSPTQSSDFEMFNFTGTSTSGVNYRQTGNNIFGSDGSSFRKVGKNIFGSDGSSCRQVGSNLFCN